MTTTKRCEVCGKEKCERIPSCPDSKSRSCLSCHGHSSPPPRPDEWEKGFDKAWENNDDDLKPLAEDIKSFIRSLLLSYGKERDREMWRKCREAVEAIPIQSESVDRECLCTQGGEETGCEYSKAEGQNEGRQEALSALDSVNPER